jgi:hypothetical protein
MVSSVTSPSNHYETLGVEPTADEDEIAEAFAAQLTLFKLRPEKTVASLAQLSLAFETLRDPIKRGAYDTSLRLKPKAVAAVPRGTAPFMATTPASRGNHSSPRLTPQPKAQARFETPADLRLASFLAAPLREPVKQREPDDALVPTHKPDPRRLSKASAEAGLAPVGESSVIDDHERSSEGNRATLVAGVLGLGILALAVSLPKGKVDRAPGPEERVERTITIDLPPARPVQDDLVPSKGRARTVVNAQGEQPALTGLGSVMPHSGEVAARRPQSQATMLGTSRYTSLDPASCKLLEENVEGRDWRRRCPGFAGYALETSESHMRQDLAMVAPNGQRSELNLTRLVASGALNRLGKTAEWRGLAGGQPRALIVRLNVAPDSDGGGPDVSNLLVVRIEPPTCIVAVVGRRPHQNERARAVADGKLPACVKG